MKICPMTEADCEKTGLLMKECFSVPWSVEGLKEMFHTEGYCSFLAKEEEEVTYGRQSIYRPWPFDRAARQR